MKQLKNQGKKKEKLDSTDGVKDIVKDLFQSNFTFLEEVVEKNALSRDKKLLLKIFSKFLPSSIITSKKYGTLLKTEKIIKLAITIASKAWSEQN